jgi:hypothetical protein
VAFHLHFKPFLPNAISYRDHVQFLSDNRFHAHYYIDKRGKHTRRSIGVWRKNCLDQRFGHAHYIEVSHFTFLPYYYHQRHHHSPSSALHYPMGPRLGPNVARKSSHVWSRGTLGFVSVELACRMWHFTSISNPYFRMRFHTVIMSNSCQTTGSMLITISTNEANTRGDQLVCGGRTV